MDDKHVFVAFRFTNKNVFDFEIKCKTSTRLQNIFDFYIYLGLIKWTASKHLIDAIMNTKKSFNLPPSSVMTTTTVSGPVPSGL